MTFIVVNDEIVSFVRFLAGSDHAYLVALNVGKKASTDNYNKEILSATFQPKGKIVLNSGNIARDEMEVGQILDLGEITLNSAEGVVVQIHKKEKTQKDEL